MVSLPFIFGYVWDMKIRLFVGLALLIGLFFYRLQQTDLVDGFHESPETDTGFIFPLTLTQIGQTDGLTDYTNTNPGLLHQALAQTIVVSDDQPVITGFTLSSSQILLEIRRGNQLIQSWQTQTNSDSKFQTQPPKVLNLGSYNLNIIAKDSDGHVAMLSHIPFQVGTEVTDNFARGAVLGQTTENDTEFTAWAQIAYLTQNPPVVVITQTILPPPDWPKPTPVVGLTQSVQNVWQKLEFNLKGLWQQILALE